MSVKPRSAGHGRFSPKGHNVPVTRSDQRGAAIATLGEATGKPVRDKPSVP